MNMKKPLIEQIKLAGITIDAVTLRTSRLMTATNGKVVLLAVNDGDKGSTFQIELKNKIFTTELDPGSVATYIWEKP